ncbi:MAG: acetyl-CoA carboxylase carboxyltransferase subunit alpha [Lachnospiraceae bacterium]|nr:acetyl-CoA carboxylase carboxyltransferase subunit alpha [Lachnospiraceae bacterium]
MDNLDITISEKLLDGQPLSPMDKVLLARHIERPKISDYVDALFTDFFEQKGDLHGKEDGSVFGGIAMFHGIPVTIIGHRKGNNLEENLAYNFGMPGPEGYRKALRLMQQAEKFGRPIITFIDTPGAYPGIEAEQFGQSQAIATNLAKMSGLKVPVIAVVTGEGNSGGALAIGVANRVYMLENSVYSILSPEGFSSILWGDSGKKEQACEVMRLTADDLMEFGVIDGIIKEPKGGAHRKPCQVFAALDEVLYRDIKHLKGKTGNELARSRYQKFRKIDEKYMEGADE